MVWSRAAQVGAFLCGLAVFGLVMILGDTFSRTSTIYSLLEIDDALFKVTDDTECGTGFNITEGEEISTEFSSIGQMLRGWEPSPSQRAMCDHDTNRRISEFAPWDYSPETMSQSHAPSNSAKPYYSSSAEPSSSAAQENRSEEGFDTEFHDTASADTVINDRSDGIHGGDDGALFVSTLADGRRGLSTAQLAGYRSRLGHFLAAFARVDTDAARREPDPPQVVRVGHRHVYTGHRGRGPFDYESELDRDRPEP